MLDIVNVGYRFVGSVTSTGSEVKTTALDTAGWNSLSFVFVPTNITGTMTELKLQSSATSGGTYEDIPGATFTTGTFPTSSGDNLPFVLSVAKVGQTNRYIKLASTGTNTDTAVVFAVLGRNTTPVTALQVTGSASGGFVQTSY